MPRIPVATEQANMNVGSPVPIRSAEAAGATGEAISAFGRGLLNVGSAFQDRLQKQKEAEDVIREKATRDNIDAAIEKNAQIALRTNGSDYVGEFEKLTRPEIDKTLNSESNSEMKSRLQAFTNGRLEVAKSRLFADQLQTNEQRLVMQVKELGNQAADKVRRTPELAEQEYKIFENEVLVPMQNKGIVDPQTYLETSTAMKNTIATQMVEGIILKKQYGRAANLLNATMPQGAAKQLDLSVDLSPADARDMGLVDQAKFDELVSNGENYKAQLVDTKGEKLTPEMTGILNSLTPVQKENFLQRIQNELKTKEGMRAQDLNAKINNLTEAALDGVPVPKETVQEVLSNIDSMTTLPDVARKTMKDTVLSAVQVGQAASLMAKTNPSNWAEITKVVDKLGDAQGGDIFNYANRKRHVQELSRAMSAILKERQDDPVGFVLKHVPETQIAAKAAADGKPEGVQPYLNAIIGAQKSLGIPESQQKILPKSQAVELGQKFESATSPQETVFLVQNLKNTYGKEYTRAIMEIAGKNDNVKDLALMGYTSSPEAELKIASNIKNRRAIRDEWSKRNPTSEKSFNNFISRSLDKYRAPLANSFADGASALGNAFFEQVKTEAQRQMNMNPGMGNIASVENAVEEIVGKNFNVVRGGKTEIITPKTVGGRPVDPSLVSGFIDHYSQPENIKSLGVYTPTNQRPELWHAELASRARWVMNPTMTGLVMAYEKGGQMMVVVDKNKRPIERSLEQVQKENKRKSSWWGF